ncbi:hypothetical protein FRB96_002570 [Tulasnella sp. 330]|nr:hypothetical protein FRB96_002570 [Tulasnella sp. 330]KAG8873129.1 hypothetical protein FRB97_006998 [Tulasnella sp. 331]
MLGIFTRQPPECSINGKKPSLKTLLFGRKGPSLSRRNKENQVHSGVANVTSSQPVSKKLPFFRFTKAKHSNAAKLSYTNDNGVHRGVEVSATTPSLNYLSQTSSAGDSLETESVPSQTLPSVCEHEATQTKTIRRKAFFTNRRKPTDALTAAQRQNRSVPKDTLAQGIAVQRPRPKMNTAECILDAADRSRRVSWVDEETFIANYIQARRREERRLARPKPVEEIPRGMKVVVVRRPTSASWTSHRFDLIPDERPVSPIDEDEDTPLARIKSRLRKVNAKKGCTTDRLTENDDKDDTPPTTLQACVDQDLDDEDTPLATVQARLQWTGPIAAVPNDQQISRRHAVKRKAEENDEGRHSRKGKQSLQAQQMPTEYSTVKRKRGTTERDSRDASQPPRIISVPPP